MIEFKLDLSAGVPYYRQIIDQIRFAIGSGQLSIGEQLPTVRALAVQLAINPNTVTKAYKELEIQNVLDAQQGTGTFVGDAKIELPKTERTRKLKSICQQYLSMASAYGFTTEEVVAELQKTGVEQQ